MSTRMLNLEGASCRIHEDGPAWEGAKTACIGGFRCDSAAAGTALLKRACKELHAQGVPRVIGPIDGDTWHSYRLIAESDGSPPFLMEPVSSPHDKAAFEACGFAPISSYVSARTTLDEAIGDGTPASLDGVTVTAWDGRNALTLMGSLFDMSAERFARNMFFKPIEKADFLALYEPLLPRVDPRLVFFARDAEGLQGFLFGLPNYLEGQNPKTVIFKTYGSKRRGVGHLLADTFHRAARALGYVNVIFALMHVENISLDRSFRYKGRIFRRYALMGKHLA